MGDESRILLVAAVQMESLNSDIEANLEHATHFVEEAAGRGAELIVLPEFMPTGYIYTVDMWNSGEPQEGPTVDWLKKTSARLGIWLGTSFLEAVGEDFYNTFLMTGPDGKEEGRVRKQTPAFAETYFTKGEAGPHIIDTELGRIGVGICYENMLSYIPQLMYSQSVDLILMPHSAPSPMPNLFFPAKAVDGFNQTLMKLAPHYARLFGVPAMMINKSGPWRSPLPFLPFLTQISSFPGLSAIADSDGTLKAQLGSEEGVLVEDVVLDPTRRKGIEPGYSGRWAFRVPSSMNLWRLVEAFGKAWYRFSGKRKRRAREISSSS
jgi:N-carbamoylputrescine amidase